MSQTVSSVLAAADGAGRAASLRPAVRVRERGQQVSRRGLPDGQAARHREEQQGPRHGDGERRPGHDRPVHHRPAEPHRHVHGQGLHAGQQLLVLFRDGAVSCPARHQLERQQPQPHGPDEGEAGPHPEQHHGQAGQLQQPDRHHAGRLHGHRLPGRSGAGGRQADGAGEGDAPEPGAPDQVRAHRGRAGRRRLEGAHGARARLQPEHLLQRLPKKAAAQAGHDGGAPPPRRGLGRVQPAADAAHGIHDGAPRQDHEGPDLPAARARHHPVQRRLRRGRDEHAHPAGRRNGRGGAGADEHHLPDAGRAVQLSHHRLRARHHDRHAPALAPGNAAGALPLHGPRGQLPPLGPPGDAGSRRAQAAPSLHGPAGDLPRPAPRHPLSAAPPALRRGRLHAAPPGVRSGRRAGVRRAEQKKRAGIRTGGPGARNLPPPGKRAGGGHAQRPAENGGLLADPARVLRGPGGLRALPRAGEGRAGLDPGARGGGRARGRRREQGAGHHLQRPVLDGGDRAGIRPRPARPEHAERPGGERQQGVRGEPGADPGRGGPAVPERGAGVPRGNADVLRAEFAQRDQPRVLRLVLHQGPVHGGALHAHGVGPRGLDRHRHQDRPERIRAEEDGERHGADRGRVRRHDPRIQAAPAANQPRGHGAGLPAHGEDRRRRAHPVEGGDRAAARARGRPAHRVPARSSPEIQVAAPACHHPGRGPDTLQSPPRPARRPAAPPSGSVHGERRPLAPEAIAAVLRAPRQDPGRPRACRVRHPGGEGVFRPRRAGGGGIRRGGGLRRPVPGPRDRPRAAGRGAPGRERRGLGRHQHRGAHHPDDPQQRGLPHPARRPLGHRLPVQRGRKGAGGPPDRRNHRSPHGLPAPSGPAPRKRHLLPAARPRGGSGADRGRAGRRVLGAAGGRHAASPPGAGRNPRLPPARGDRVRARRRGHQSQVLPGDRRRRIGGAERGQAAARRGSPAGGVGGPRATDGPHNLARPLQHPGSQNGVCPRRGCVLLGAQQGQEGQLGDHAPFSAGTRGAAAVDAAHTLCLPPGVSATGRPAVPHPAARRVRPGPVGGRAVLRVGIPPAAQAGLLAGARAVAPRAPRPAAGPVLRHADVPHGRNQRPQSACGARAGLRQRFVDVVQKLLPGAAPGAPVPVPRLWPVRRGLPVRGRLRGQRTRHLPVEAGVPANRPVGQGMGVSRGAVGAGLPYPPPQARRRDSPPLPDGPFSSAHVRGLGQPGGAVVRVRRPRVLRVGDPGCRGGVPAPGRVQGGGGSAAAAPADGRRRGHSGGSGGAHHGAGELGSLRVRSDGGVHAQHGALERPGRAGHLSPRRHVLQERDPGGPSLQGISGCHQKHPHAVAHGVSFSWNRPLGHAPPGGAAAARLGVWSRRHTHGGRIPAGVSSRPRVRGGGGGLPAGGRRDGQELPPTKNQGQAHHGVPPGHGPDRPVQLGRRVSAAGGARRHREQVLHGASGPVLPLRAGHRRQGFHGPCRQPGTEQDADRLAGRPSHEHPRGRHRGHQKHVRGKIVRRRGAGRERRVARAIQRRVHDRRQQPARVSGCGRGGLEAHVLQRHPRSHQRPRRGGRGRGAGTGDGQGGTLRRGVHRPKTHHSPDGEHHAAGVHVPQHPSRDGAAEGRGAHARVLRDDHRRVQRERLPRHERQGERSDREHHVCEFYSQRNRHDRGTSVQRSNPPSQAAAVRVLPAGPEPRLRPADSMLEFFFGRAYFDGRRVPVRGTRRFCDVQRMRTGESSAQPRTRKRTRFARISLCPFGVASVRWPGVAYVRRPRVAPVFRPGVAYVRRPRVAPVFRP